MQKEFLTSALTIGGGVLVFVVGNTFLRIFLEPVVELRKSIGFVTGLCLRHQAKITNGNLNPEIQEDFKSGSSSLNVNVAAIPFYRSVRRVFGLPKERDILEASRWMNLISSQPHGDGLQGNVSECNEALRGIKAALKIRVDYSHGRADSP